jgi:hypothetical protein
VPCKNQIPTAYDRTRYVVQLYDVAEEHSVTVDMV